jgi:hypothetical protein
MLEAGNTTNCDITPEWIAETQVGNPGRREICARYKKNRLSLFMRRLDCCEQGWYHEKLFHPYVEKYFFAWVEKVFYFYRIRKVIIPKEK